MDEHVLLVEDDSSIREVTTLGLEQAGYRVDRQRTDAMRCCASARAPSTSSSST